ncbi:hypothetical protein BE11_11510 [Sorangium cellulosum]|nr:hypothetical protein BE11_11510 [Sorangium cellulosum]
MSLAPHDVSLAAITVSLASHRLSLATISASLPRSPPVEIGFGACPWRLVTLSLPIIFVSLAPLGEP